MGESQSEWCVFFWTQIICAIFRFRFICMSPILRCRSRPRGFPGSLSTLAVSDQISWLMACIEFLNTWTSVYQNANRANLRSAELYVQFCVIASLRCAYAYIKSFLLNFASARQKKASLHLLSWTLAVVIQSRRIDQICSILSLTIVCFDRLFLFSWRTRVFSSNSFSSPLPPLPLAREARRRLSSKVFLRSRAATITSISRRILVLFDHRFGTTGACFGSSWCCVAWQNVW